MLRRRCFFATLVGGRCSTVSTLHRVWTHSNVSTLPILFDYSHSVQGVRTGRLLLSEVHSEKKLRQFPNFASGEDMGQVLEPGSLCQRLIALRLTRGNKKRHDLLEIEPNPNALLHPFSSCGEK